MRKDALVAALATAVVVLAGPVAGAGAAAREDAQRFANAVLRAKERIAAAAPEVTKAFAAVEGACEPWWSSDGDPEFPRALERKLVALSNHTIVRPVIEPTRGTFDLLVADLYAIPTRDPVLRAARQAWRDEAEALRQYPLVDDACQLLLTWRSAGFAPAAAPDVPFAPLISYYEPNAQVRRNHRRLEAAERRLRKLGVSPGAARRFTGVDLYEAIWDGDEFDVLMPPRTAVLDKTTGE